VSETLKAGRSTTEHARAWRAEAVGVALVVAGLAGVHVYGWMAIAVVALGVLLVGWTATAYIHARSVPKAAAERPRVLTAPKG
jgi:Flp pilus assembly protein TadB